MTSSCKPSFTAGPWAATTRRGSWDWVVYSVADPNIEICQPFHDGTDLNEVGEANARLIAEAGTIAHETGLTPRQLAERCKELGAFAELIVHYNDRIRNGKAPTQNQWEMFVQQARAALAKATGGA